MSVDGIVPQWPDKGKKRAECSPWATVWRPLVYTKQIIPLLLVGGVAVYGIGRKHIQVHVNGQVGDKIHSGSNQKMHSETYLVIEDPFIVVSVIHVGPPGSGHVFICY